MNAANANPLGRAFEVRFRELYRYCRVLGTTKGFAHLARMARYFFDLRSAGSASIDEEGQDLPDMEAAHDAAISALSDVIRDIAVEGSKDQFAIEVRDEFGPVLRVSAVLKSTLFRKQ
jgi:hypothetical protein